jgi:hypothetical protein
MSGQPIDADLSEALDGWPAAGRAPAPTIQEAHHGRENAITTSTRRLIVARFLFKAIGSPRTTATSAR